MRLALADVFRAKWTDDLHEEWIAAVLRSRPDLTRARLERTRRLMDENVRDALVTGYDELVSDLTLPDSNDRHVLAAAIKSAASAIVTFDLRDFPRSELQRFGIKAIHPDEFLLSCFRRERLAVLGSVQRQRESLKTRFVRGRIAFHI